MSFSEVPNLSEQMAFPAVVPSVTLAPSGKEGQTPPGQQSQQQMMPSSSSPSFLGGESSKGKRS